MSDVKQLAREAAEKIIPDAVITGEGDAAKRLEVERVRRFNVDMATKIIAATYAPEIERLTRRADDLSFLIRDTAANCLDDPSVLQCTPEEAMGKLVAGWDALDGTPTPPVAQESTDESP